MTKRAVVGVLGALMMLGGCAHQRVVDQAPAKAEPYRIGCADVLDVVVWHDPDVSRELPVRPDGVISLPIAGELAAAGKTTAALEQEIRQKLLPFVQDPHVTVIVKEMNSSRVFVTGEVQHPGAYPLSGRTSLVQAIALAGGLSEFASANSIVVIRKQGKRIPVHYSDLVSDDGEVPQFVLEPGDTVVVP